MLCALLRTSATKADCVRVLAVRAGLEFLENAGWEYVLGRTRAYEAAAEAAVQSGGVVALPSQGAAPPDAEQEWWMVYKVSGATTRCAACAMRGADCIALLTQSQDSAPAAALLAALGGELPAPASRNDDRGKRARGERGGDHSALAGTAGATATGLSADEELATALALSEREAQEAVDMELAMALTKSAPRDGGGA